MLLSEYQYLARRTRNESLSPKDRLIEGCLGACGESGEMAENVKKHLYQGHDLNVSKIKSEMGDALWYMSQVADECGFTLDEVAHGNIEKLAARYPNGFEKERSINREDKE